MPIDVVLAVDAIHRPLTGIGRYAFELARGLQEHPDIASLKYFSMGRWVQWSSLLPPQISHAAAPKRTLRSVLAANASAVKIYQHVIPQVSRWRLRRERHALFHSPNYFLPPFPGPKIATVHDLSHVLYPHFHPDVRIAYMNQAFPNTLRRADHLITDAQSVRQEIMERFNWPAERISAVPLGVDPDFFPRTRADLQPTLQAFGLRAGEYALCVGTIEPRKNIDRLLTAYEALPQTLRLQHPLVLAGAPGWQSETTHRRIKQAEHAGWLRYLSFVPQKSLPLLYAGALIFVYPSLYEGFGLPPLEAMASGVPVITSNVASLPEVVGNAACLIDPRDTDQISSALLQALQDDAWRQRIASAGLAQAGQFTWENCVDQTVNVYRHLMAH